MGLQHPDIFRASYVRPHSNYICMAIKLDERKIIVDLNTPQSLPKFLRQMLTPDLFASAKLTSLLNYVPDSA